MALTTYGANYICSVATGNDMWLALCVTVPSSSDTGSTISEPTALDYGRVFLSYTNWSTPSLGAGTFDVGLSFFPTTNWGNVNSYALCTDETGGEIYAFNYLSSTAALGAGTMMYIDSGMIRYEAR